MWWVLGLAAAGVLGLGVVGVGAYADNSRQRNCWIRVITIEAIERE